MEHHFFAQMFCVHTELTSLTKLYVQPPSISCMRHKLNFFSDHVQKFPHGLAVMSVSKKLFFSSLPYSLINYSKLEVTYQAMLIKFKKHVGSLRTEDWLKRSK